MVETELNCFKLFSHTVGIIMFQERFVHGLAFDFRSQFSNFTRVDSFLEWSEIKNCQKNNKPTKQDNPYSPKLLKCFCEAAHMAEINESTHHG